MQITVQLPDDLTDHENPGREALEALVAEGYRSGLLSKKQARSMLGFQTGYEMDGFLKRWQIDRDAYGVEEYEQDLQTLKKMRGTESTTAR
jgi:predicted HTH domain antitoxin